MATEDGTLRATLREREMRAERRINVLRAVVLGGAALIDVSYALVGGLFSWKLAVLALLALPFLVVYLLLVHRLARESTYRPWLKYVTVSVDYSLTLAVFIVYRQIGFFATPADQAGVPEMITFLILLNLLSAFRHSRAIIVYSTLLATGIGTWMTWGFPGTALEFYTPVALIASGWLALLLSSEAQALFLRLRQRERLLRFLPRHVVQGVDAGWVRLELGGVKDQATILLSDLRDFTRLCEDRDPAEVVALLNEYFTAMAGVIWEHGGTIDKFIGDAILAVYGVPVPQEEHVFQAVESALAMHHALARLNREHARRGVPVLRMGIALHTGPVLAGNVGAPERMEYTVMGDSVNVTARIGELNKQYGTELLLSESTYEQVRERFPCRLVAEAKIRGRHHPLRVYTPAT
jgi:adenylate cyclase